MVEPIMQDIQATPPLINPDVDLRDFSYMPLDVSHLRDSDFALLSSAEAFRAGMMLWCASWHQVPAGSLPNDDKILSHLAGFGRVVKEWKKHRDEALYGWVLCSDGRYYHPVICEKANNAFDDKLKYRYNKLTDRLRKENKKRQDMAQPELIIPSFDDWKASGKSEEIQDFEPTFDNTGFTNSERIPSESGNLSDGNAAEFQRKNALRERERDINNNNINVGEQNSAETADEVLAKAAQVCQQNADDIIKWQPPTLDEMREMLSKAGFQGEIDQQKYDVCVEDFKAYYAEQAIKAKPIATESLRRNKLRYWIQNADAWKSYKNSNKKHANAKRYGGTNDPLAVNDYWRPGETGIVAPNTKFDFTQPSEHEQPVGIAQ